MHLGVCTKTLRRWDAAGRISCIRTAGGHRRFSMVEIRGLREEKHPGNDKSIQGEGGVAVYCRVSSHEQKAKGDLARQVAATTKYCFEGGLGEPLVVITESRQIWYWQFCFWEGCDNEGNGPFPPGGWHSQIKYQSVGHEAFGPHLKGCNAVLKNQDSPLVCIEPGWHPPTE